MSKIHSVLVLIGFGFLAYLIWSVGPTQLWGQLKALGWGVFPLILSEGLANFAHTVGWRYCLSGEKRGVPMHALFRMAMAGFAINYLTPSASIGGEITKAGLLASHQGGSDAISSVLVDKVCMAFAHLLFVVVGSLLVLWSVKLPPALWLAIVLSSILVTAGIASFLLLQKHGKLGAVLRWLVARKLAGPRVAALEKKISEVDEALKSFYRQGPSRLYFSVGWHLVGHCAGIVQTWIFVSTTNQSATVSGIVAAGVLCSWFDFLTFAVPLNLGTLEGSRLVALKAIGYDPVLGMTYGVAVRIAQLFWAFYGLVCYGLEVGYQKKTRVPR